MGTTKHAGEEAIRWKILPENIDHVVKMNPIQIELATWCKVQLCNANGQDINIWTPINVVSDLKYGLKLNAKDSITVIKSLG